MRSVETTGDLMARKTGPATVAANAEVAALVAERAYFRAQNRGFAPGHELDDWLVAEREVNALLATPAPAAPVRARKRKPAR
jgi:hypothetical protein